MTGLDRLNALPAPEAESELRSCCGSRVWAARVAARRPFAEPAALLAAADEESAGLTTEDWLEAFRAHPRIGESRAALPRTERERGWSAGEQAGMAAAAEATRSELRRANDEYERRFGFIFIVCASGLTGEQMLERLRARLANDAPTELRVAADEQRSITQLRLRKLLDEAEPRP